MNADPKPAKIYTREFRGRTPKEAEDRFHEWKKAREWKIKITQLVLERLPIEPQDTRQFKRLKHPNTYALKIAYVRSHTRR
jgi:hypothetical protein